MAWTWPALVDTCYLKVIKIQVSCVESIYTSINYSYLYQNYTKLPESSLHCRVWNFRHAQFSYICGDFYVCFVTTQTVRFCKHWPVIGTIAVKPGRFQTLAISLNVFWTVMTAQHFSIRFVPTQKIQINRRINPKKTRWDRWRHRLLQFALWKCA